jgi:hypothetical protein
MVSVIETATADVGGIRRNRNGARMRLCPNDKAELTPEPTIATRIRLEIVNQVTSASF